MKLSDIMCPSFFQLHVDIKKHLHTHYVLKGGRGSTKSSFVSIEIILNLMKDNDANCVVLRKIGNTIESSVYNQLLWAIDKLNVGDYWQIKKTPMEMIYIPNGNKILFRSSDDPAKLKSTKFAKGYCKYVWFEEWTDFDGMVECRSINQSLLRGGNEFCVFYSYNPPRTISHWVYSELLNERDDRIVHSSTYLDVPKEWLGEQFYIEAEHLKETNELAYKNEYLGEPTGTGGAVFPNVEIRKITDEEISKFDKIYDGNDFGFAVDANCYLQTHFDKTRKKLYIFNEIYKVGLSNKQLYEEIKKIKIGRSVITCDSAEPKSIAELSSYGLRVQGAKKGPDSVEYGMRWLQSLDKIIIDNVRCPNAAREFSTYEYEQDKMGNFKSKYPDENNHSIDACRYALEDEMKVNTMLFGYRNIL